MLCLGLGFPNSLMVVGVRMCFYALVSLCFTLGLLMERLPKGVLPVGYIGMLAADLN